MVADYTAKLGHIMCRKMAHVEMSSKRCDRLISALAPTAWVVAAVIGAMGDPAKGGADARHAEEGGSLFERDPGATMPVSTTSISSAVIIAVPRKSGAVTWMR